MTIKTKIRTLLMTVSALLLVACSADNTTERDPESVTEASVQMMRAARVALGDTGWGDIRVLLHNNGTTVSGLFKYYNEGDWLTRLKLKSDTRTYRLYGYMPDDAQVTSSLINVTESSAVLRLQGLSPLATKDYCIVTGVRQAISATDQTDATRGNFSFEYAGNRQDYINLLLDHLQSRVVFRMQVGEEYDDVRTIKVKQMSLSLDDVGTLSADVTLTNGTGISSITYSGTTGSENKSLTIKEAETQHTLTITPTIVCSAYVIPDATLLSKLYLVTEYDVYDKQGNKVDERRATNKLTRALDELQRGEERILTVTVAPSYLYVLSDGDLNNPPVVVQ